MPLTIPDSAKCLTPGCRRECTHVLSLRMGRRDTGAGWAPNTEAYFCTPCAIHGADIAIVYAPNKTKAVKVDVAVVTKIASRRTPILS